MTRCIRFGFVLTLLALGSCGVAQEPEHVIVPPDDVAWGPASPKLPGGAQFARISGDPSKRGEPEILANCAPPGSFGEAGPHATSSGGTMTCSGSCATPHEPRARSVRTNPKRIHLVI